MIKCSNCKEGKLEKHTIDSQVSRVTLKETTTDTSTRTDSYWYCDNCDSYFHDELVIDGRNDIDVIVSTIKKNFIEESTKSPTPVLLTEHVKKYQLKFISLNNAVKVLKALPKDFIDPGWLEFKDEVCIDENSGLEGHGAIDYFDCPKCKSINIIRMSDYCDGCGSKIKWINENK